MPRGPPGAARGGGLQRGHAGERREWGSGAETAPGAEDRRECPDGQEADATERGERGKARRGAVPDIAGERLRLCHDEAKPRRAPSDSGRPLLPERVDGHGRVGFEGREAGLRAQARQVGRRFGIAVEEQLVQLVALPRGLRDAFLALCHEQREDRRLVIRDDARERGRFAPDMERDRLGIQPVVLVAAPSAPSPRGRPARASTS